MFVSAGQLDGAELYKGDESGDASSSSPQQSAVEVEVESSSNALADLSLETATLEVKGSCASHFFPLSSFLNLALPTNKLLLLKMPSYRSRLDFVEEFLRPLLTFS